MRTSSKEISKAQIIGDGNEDKKNGTKKDTPFFVLLHKMSLCSKEPGLATGAQK